mgnify:CR=1 FL=1
MDIFRIIGVGLATAVTALIVKQVKPEIAIIVGVAGGVIMLLMLVDSVTSILSVFSSLTQKSGLSTGIFAAVLKIIGVGYITEFSANLCVDAGSTSIANKILLAGKILILVSAIPIVTNLIDIISGLLPWPHLSNYLK